MSLYDNIKVIRESIEDARDNYARSDFEIFKESLIQMLKRNGIIDDEYQSEDWESSDEWYDSGCEWDSSY